MISTPAMEGELSAEYAKFVKWGVKEGNLDFRDIDPFKGEVKADEVPMAEGTEPKKRGRKPKKAA